MHRNKSGFTIKANGFIYFLFAVLTLPYTIVLTFYLAIKMLYYKSMMRYMDWQKIRRLKHIEKRFEKISSKYVEEVTKRHLENVKVKQEEMKTQIKNQLLKEFESQVTSKTNEIKQHEKNLR